MLSFLPWRRGALRTFSRVRFQGMNRINHRWNRFNTCYSQSRRLLYQDQCLWSHWIENIFERNFFHITKPRIKKEEIISLSLSLIWCLFRCQCNRIELREVLWIRGGNNSSIFIFSSFFHSVNQCWWEDAHEILSLFFLLFSSFSLFHCNQNVRFIFETLYENDPSKSWNRRSNIFLLHTLLSPSQTSILSFPFSLLPINFNFVPAMK